MSIKSAFIFQYLACTGGYFSLFLSRSPAVKQSAGCQERSCYLTTYCPFADDFTRKGQTILCLHRQDNGGAPARCRRCTMAQPYLQRYCNPCSLSRRWRWHFSRARGAKHSKLTYQSSARTAIVWRRWWPLVRDNKCEKSFLSSRYILSAAKLLYSSPKRICFRIF